MGSGGHFRDKNTPVHQTLLTHQWKTENNIPSITWPTQSSDINIIKNMWKIIKCHVQETANIENRQHLTACVLQRWRELPSAYIHDMYDSVVKNLFCYN